MDGIAVFVFNNSVVFIMYRRMFVLLQAGKLIAFDQGKKRQTDGSCLRPRCRVCVLHQVMCIQAFNLRQSSNTLSNYMHSCDEVSKLFNTFFKAAVSVLSPILLTYAFLRCK